MYTWTDGAELYHHGIKGQKWGVRRYQKKDGSLTPEGKKRYVTDSDFKKKVDNDLQEKANRLKVEKERLEKERSVKELEKQIKDEKNKIDQIINSKSSDSVNNIDKKQIDYGQQIIDKMNKVGSFALALGNLAGNSITAYNNIARINNAFSKDPDKNWRYIPNAQGNNKNNNKNNNNDKNKNNNNDKNKNDNNSNNSQQKKKK